MSGVQEFLPFLVFRRGVTGNPIGATAWIQGTRSGEPAKGRNSIRRCALQSEVSQVMAGAEVSVLARALGEAHGSAAGTVSLLLEDQLGEIEAGFPEPTVTG
jgi:hypothetical protein